MTDKKLTPRVGDRVLVSPNSSVPSNRSYLGYVRNVRATSASWLSSTPPSSGSRQTVLDARPIAEYGPRFSLWWIVSRSNGPKDGRRWAT